MSTTDDFCTYKGVFVYPTWTAPALSNSPPVLQLPIDICASVNTALTTAKKERESRSVCAIWCQSDTCSSVLCSIPISAVPTAERLHHVSLGSEPFGATTYRVTAELLHTPCLH